MGVEYTIRAEREIDGLDLYVNGKALAHCEDLGPIAERAGVRPLLSFFSQDPDEARAFREENDIPPPPEGYPPIRWFDAADGLATVRSLIVQLEADPSIVTGAPAEGDDADASYKPWAPDADELISDLHEFEDVLDQLDDAGVRWHLSVDF